MNINAKDIAEFRAKTGLPMMECKKALMEAQGDQEKALEILKKRGIAKAASKSERETKSGMIDSYVHMGGKIGVLVEVLTETDFVAKNEEFRTFVHEVALHVAASNPQCISREDLSKEAVEKEKKDFEAQAREQGKSEEIVEKMVEGRLQKYYSEVCLLDQPYVKDPNITVGDLLNQLIAKIGENIVISRFARYEIGQK